MPRSRLAVLRAVLCALLGLALGLLAAGCTGPESARPPTAAVPTSSTSVIPASSAATLRQQYMSAIEDARQADPSEISTALTPVAPYVDALERRPNPGGGRPHVRVVTWTGVPGDGLPRRALRTDVRADSVTTDGNLWVTLVPFVRDFCRTTGLEGEALDIRLAQRLGLPPDVEYSRFVEMWVRPEDLFRPCPDPEISDRECGLRPPVPERAVRIDTAHAAWMDATRAASYGRDGYPWTRLGYTYDWHPATSEVGPSEYIIRTGAVVEVASVTPTAAYCRASGRR